MDSDEIASEIKRRRTFAIISHPDAGKTTLTERIGPRARSRLFEMCRVIKMPLIEDFRLRKQSV